MFNHEFCTAEDDQDEEGGNGRVRVLVLSSAGARMPKYTRFRTGQICFSHTHRDSFSHPSRGSGFSLFLTCRMMYVEAFSIYWETVALEVARAPSVGGGCGLLAVCNYLPAAIKENLRHLRNISLPIMGAFQSAPGDETWTPTLLLQFPKLATLEFTDVDLLGQEPWDAIRDLLADPDGDDYPYNTFRVRPFRLLTGESPAEYIERKIGVQRSSGVTIISRRELPEDCSSPFTCQWYMTRVSPAPLFLVTRRMNCANGPTTILEERVARGL